MPDRLVPGTVTTLREGVRRIVAPNPGLMTGPGTNTYIIGERETAVIDPGPAIERHTEKVLATARPIRWILATHTHTDHSPAVAELASASGAEVVGLPAPPGAHQDATFRPVRQPRDGDWLQADGVRLEVIHTPGHASNHLCFFDSDSGWLYTGDHIINGSTVVIDPPDGHMGDYLRSLRRLRELPLSAIAGGHGEVIREPQAAIDALIEHRLAREARVVDALAATGGGTLDELVEVAYADVASTRHGLASRSLLAHLLKLADDGHARQTDGRWAPVRN